LKVRDRKRRAGRVTIGYAVKGSPNFSPSRIPDPDKRMGPSILRALMKEYGDIYPEVESFGGLRITGPRAGPRSTDIEQIIPLRRPRAP